MDSPAKSKHRSTDEAGLNPLDDGSEQPEDENPLNTDMTGDGDEEAQAAKPLTQPIQPTQAMIDEHNVSHLPYRPWCPACVRGKGKSMAHRYDRDKDDSLFPVISIDYIADHEMPVLVVHDRASKSHFAHACRVKECLTLMRSARCAEI